MRFRLFHPGTDFLLCVGQSVAFTFVGRIAGIDVQYRAVSVRQHEGVPVFLAFFDPFDELRSVMIELAHAAHDGPLGLPRARQFEVAGIPGRCLLF